MAQDIISKLKVTIPQLSLEIGTPERKLVDAVSESISESYMDQYITGTNFDIDTKSGLELEQFCLVPGTPVVTPTGIVPIERLNVGDEVVTHTGQHGSVIATSGREVSEKTVTVRTGIGVGHTMTLNHPVLATRRSQLRQIAPQVGNWQRDGSKGAEHAFRLRGLGSRSVWDSRSVVREWVSAGDLQKGDIVWSAEPQSAGTTSEMPVGEKRLAGYYLAEGHVVEHRGNLGFTFHEDESSYLAEVDNLLRSEWGVSNTRTARSGLGKSAQVNCWSKELCKEVVEQYGKGAAGKHIPWALFDSSEDLTPVLATYWNGDGTSDKGSMRAKTVSVDLAHQLFTYMQRMGLSPRLNKVDAGPCTILGRDSSRRDTWTVSVDGDSARKFSESIDYPLDGARGRSYAPTTVRIDGYVGSVVTKAEVFDYEGTVHNIEVEGDNSYQLLGSFAVHNCGIFGFGRLQGRRATGVIRVEVTVESTQDIQVQNGTQFYVAGGGETPGTNLYFHATQRAVLPKGHYSVDVPVECTVIGSVGNVAPGTLSSVGSTLGIATVTNLSPMTGGIDVEGDDELRARFKSTLLRNVAGTADFYLALAYADQNVSRATVFGPVSTYRTQIEAPASSVTLDVNQDVKFVWCVTPETRVLTESLDWVPVRSLSVGDKLVGFDEDQPEGRGNKRCWRPSEVTATSVTPSPTYRVNTTGPSVTSTGDHMWLVSKRGPLLNSKKQGAKRGDQGVQWVKTSDLVPGDVIRYIPPWEEDRSFEAGYLSGFLDGEGTCSSRSNISFAQNTGPVLDNVLSLLDEYGFASRKIHDSNSQLSLNPRCKEVVVNGGLDEMLRLFGTLKPKRLTPKFMDKFYGSVISSKWSHYVTVESVEEAGVQDVVELSTSTKTLVAEGLLSHNTQHTSVFQDLGTSNERWYTPGIDYQWLGGTSANLSRFTNGLIQAGQVIDVEFEYTTKASRNDPQTGITNKVDLFVNGADPVTVTERTVIGASTFNTTTGHELNRLNFKRLRTAGDRPATTNRFMRLGSVPILAFPRKLVIKTDAGPIANTYEEGVHYWVVTSDTLMRGSDREITGIEWAAAGPPSNTPITLTYSYNRTPQLLNAIIKNAKQITTDVVVHEAEYRYMQVYLDVEYDRGVNLADVAQNIQESLRRYFAAQYFGTWIESSDLLYAVRAVRGVDNAQLTKSTSSATNYGIKTFSHPESTVPLNTTTADFKLDDDQLPVFMNAVVTRKANR